MTNGIVSVLSGARVIVKVIVGCDGYNAKLLADRLRKRRAVDVDIAYDAALDVGFGCPQCLVVMDADRIRFEGDEPVDDWREDLRTRYRKTFTDPKFNPRWERGTCGDTRVVTMAPKGAKA